MGSNMKIIGSIARLAVVSGACSAVIASGTTWAANDQPLTENWSPLKIKGGTGSPGNPVAIY